MDKRQARAFEAFAAESGAELLRIATLLTSDPYIAEDVYQETLQRLAARWSRVDSPRAFCRRVMHNIVIDQSRAAARRPRESRLFPVSDSTDPRSADPHDAVEVRPALFAAPPGVQVSSHARDSLGRPAVEISWFDRVTRVTLATFEDPSTTRMLEQTDTAAPAAVNGHTGSTGRDLYLSVTRARAVPPSPYR